MLASKKRSPLEIVLTVVFTVVGAWAGWTLYDYDHRQSDSGQVTEMINQTCADLNKQMPKMVDAATRMDSASAGPDKSIRYRYTIVSSELIDTGHLADKLRPHILDEYRTNPGLAAFRDNGVTMIYDYFDKSGNALGEFQVGPKDLSP